MVTQLRNIAAKFAGSKGTISLAKRHAQFLAENSKASEASELKKVLKESDSRSFDIETGSFKKLVKGLSDDTSDTPHADRVEAVKKRKKRKARKDS